VGYSIGALPGTATGRGVAIPGGHVEDLVRWLGEQLDEDERVALTWPADQRSWTEYGDRRLEYASGASEGVSAVNVKADAPLGWERIYVKRDGIGLVDHIAAHDPARVLREIDAKRRLLDDYVVTARIRDEAAARIKAAGDLPDAKDLDTWDRAQREAAILEGPLKLAAMPLADRSGYQETWRP